MGNRDFLGGECLPVSITLVNKSKLRYNAAWKFNRSVWGWLHGTMIVGDKARIMVAVHKICGFRFCCNLES